MRKLCAPARAVTMERYGLIEGFLKPLAEDGAALTREQAAAVLEEILSGDVPEVETAALLTVLATRGEQAPELAGFVE
jgi:anthranilate phosphoribosyltransferase